MFDKKRYTEQLIQALLHLDSERVGDLLVKIRQENGQVRIDDLVVPALEKIGLSWEQGRVSLSQVYMAGRICEKAVEKSLGSEQPLDLKSGPRIAICVLEDYHALGKRMVKSALQSAGYRPMDFGHGCRAQTVVEAAIRDKVDILMVSCLMLASAVRVRGVAEGLRKAGGDTVLVVGGAPFRLEPRLWKEVGASAMGRNSTDAVRIVRGLREKRQWK